MIVLVTGSRYAKAEEHGMLIRGALLWATGARGGQPGEGHALWDGLAGGVDGICHEIAHQDFGWVTERFRAAWSECDPTWVDPLSDTKPCVRLNHRKVRSNGTTEYCPAAGFRRNQTMVDALAKVDGRKVVVGFPIPALGSRGTIDCLTRALLAGLPTISVPLTSKDAL